MMSTVAAPRFMLFFMAPAELEAVLARQRFALGPGPCEATHHDVWLLPPPHTRTFRYHEVEPGVTLFADIPSMALAAESAESLLAAIEAAEVFGEGLPTKGA